MSVRQKITEVIMTTLNYKLASLQLQNVFQLGNLCPNKSAMYVDLIMKILGCTMGLNIFS